MNILPATENTKLAFSIPQFAQSCSIGRTKLYEEIKNGNLIAKKMGKRTIITLEDGLAYLASLPSMMSDSEKSDHELS